MIELFVIELPVEIVAVARSVIELVEIRAHIGEQTC